MSKPSKVHARFWQSMAERFGKRWVDEYGDAPTKAWADLLDRYTQEIIAAAIERLSTRSEHQRAHPPTHAEFSALLESTLAAHRRRDETNHIRGFWRSLIVDECARTLGQSFEQFERTLIANVATLGADLKGLLDSLEDLEIRNGRSAALLEHSSAQARKIATQFKMARSAA